MISGTPPLKNSLAAGPDGLTIHLRPYIKSKFWYKCYSCWSWVHRRCSELASPSLHHGLWSCSKCQTPSPSTPKAIPTSSLFPSPTLIPPLMGKLFSPSRSPPLMGKGNFPLSLLSRPLLPLNGEVGMFNGCFFHPPPALTHLPLHHHTTPTLCLPLLTPCGRFQPFLFPSDSTNIRLHFTV